MIGLSEGRKTIIEVQLSKHFNEPLREKDRLAKNWTENEAVAAWSSKFGGSFE